MKEMSLGVEDLAHLSGLSERTIERMRSGEPSTFHSLKQVAFVLKVDPGSLRYGSNLVIKEEQDDFVRIRLEVVFPKDLSLLLPELNAFLKHVQTTIPDRVSLVSADTRSVVFGVPRTSTSGLPSLLRERWGEWQHRTLKELVTVLPHDIPIVWTNNNEAHTKFDVIEAMHNEAKARFNEQGASWSGSGDEGRLPASINAEFCTTIKTVICYIYDDYSREPVISREVSARRLSTASKLTSQEYQLLQDLSDKDLLRLFEQILSEWQQAPTGKIHGIGYVYKLIRF